MKGRDGGKERAGTGVGIDRRAGTGRESLAARDARAAIYHYYSLCATSEVTIKSTLCESKFKSKYKYKSK